METTLNFKLGLKAAYDSLEAEGKLTDRDTKVVGAVLANDEIIAPNGVRIFAMKRIHAAVRRLYAKTTGRLLPVINWLVVLEWLQANWKQIVKIILTIVPFLIL